MDIKVLGSGCCNCSATVSAIERVAREKGVDVRITKVEDLKEIVALGVMSTPGVVIDGRVVHAGGIPTPAQIAGWL